MSTTPGQDAAGQRRTIRLALRLGVLMLSSGAQAHEVETSLRTVMTAFGLPGGEAVITYSTVAVSYVTEADDAGATAMQAVRRWQPDYNRLAVAAALVRGIARGEVSLTGAEDEVDRIATIPGPYPRWLAFSAPALLSLAVTIMFGGTGGDALATLAIGLAIQPTLERIERSELSAFFQVVFGVTATTLLVVLLVKLGLPVNGGLVLTGSLLRFLPGAPLVSGMHDFIDGAILSGTARLAEVALLGGAIAGAASLILTLGARLDVPMQITADGRVDWAGPVLVLAGMTAVAFYAFRLGVPRRALLTTSALGGIAVVITRGLVPGTDDLSRGAGILLAALAIGVVGQALAHRVEDPAALWMVPAILPLLPAPATLLPLLAETEAARQALQGQAVQTAFAIGVGVACGSIVAETYLRYRSRVIPHQMAGGALGRFPDRLMRGRIRGRARPRTTDGTPRAQGEEGPA